MRRFYSLEVERDLFSRLVLVRQWAGSAQRARGCWTSMQGRGEALAALQALELQKVRRGYRGR
jgi:predicted DNA-binding WGR domain protein